MTSAADARRRFAYHAWATRTVAGRLLDGEGHERARAYLAHACASDRVWLLRLRGEPSAGVALWPAMPPEGVLALARHNEEAWTAFLDALDDAGLERPAAYANTRGEHFVTPVADVLEHVLLHGAYHRGQAAAALRAAGTPPPSTDFVAWARAGTEDIEQ